MRSLLVVSLMLLAGVYLSNPTAGWIEFIPDGAPFVGNLDEAAATALLLSGLRYFGLDVTGLMDRSGGAVDGKSARSKRVIRA